jgi:bacterioferritin-associated ferredoxin
MYVCICAAVSDRQINDAVRAGASSLDALAVELGVGAGCGCCRGLAEELIAAAGVSPTQVREVSRLAARA